MIMIIHSSFGVLECKPMTLQALENSIPDAPKEQTEQVQGDSIERGVVESDECPF